MQFLHGILSFQLVRCIVSVISGNCPFVLKKKKKKCWFPRSPLHPLRVKKTQVHSLEVKLQCKTYRLLTQYFSVGMDFATLSLYISQALLAQGILMQKETTVLYGKSLRLFQQNQLKTETGEYFLHHWTGSTATGEDVGFPTFACL